MRQGETESDVNYMKRFRINLDILIAARGKHVLYSPELVEANDKTNIIEDEKKLEESRFKAIVFLKRSDPVRYGAFIAELQNNTYMDNDLYPDSESNALDLIVRRSGAFNCAIISNTGRGGSNIRDRGGRRRDRGFNFAQNNNSAPRQERTLAGTALIAGTDRCMCNIKCYRCQR